MSETPNDFHQRNFSLVNIIEKNAIGGDVDNSHYRMTRDGFMHIALTFTGAKGNAFRVTIIEAFNAMERELQATRRLPESYTTEELLALTSSALSREKARADAAERTKSQISDKKTASAMATASVAKRQLSLVSAENMALKESQGLSGEYRTILAWAVEYPQLQNKSLGSSFSAIAKRLGLPAKDTTVMSEFGSLIKMWHRSVVDEYILKNL